MSSSAWEARFGSFDLSPNSVDRDYEVRLVGLRRGRPVAVTSVVDSMIQDGAIERRERSDNRDQEFIVGFKAPDAAALAQAEESLFLEAQKARNEFAWTPPDGYGAETVFDVLWADMEFVDADDWDLDELRGYRTYLLTLRALPFGRDALPIEVPALLSGVTPASTTIADGTSATNWTGTETVTASGGTLRQTVDVTPTALPGGGTSYASASDWYYTPGAPITAFATQQYLSVDTITPTAGYTSGGSVFAWADGVRLELAAILTVSGATRWVFVCPDASVTTLRVRIEYQNAFEPGSGGMASALHQIDNLTSSNQAPATPSTPGREGVRTVEVEGSARTPASLAIEHETLGLGQVLVYTDAALSLDGYTPDLRRHRTSGGSGESASSSTISGKTSEVSTSIAETFQVPIGPLPRGAYLLLAKGSGTFTDVQVTTSTVLPGGTAVGATTTRNRDVQYVAGFAVLADLTLPVVDVPAGVAGYAQLEVLAMGALSVQYDEMFLCYLGEDSALTLVDCGGTGSATLGSADSRLWIDSASVERPSPTIWLGTAADRADARHAGSAVGAWMAHQFVPSRTLVFVANSGGANPAISARYHRRAHTHMTTREAS